ncbi:MAG: BamA/TamA family outer membrane protein [Reichenbachiella sp.]
MRLPFLVLTLLLVANTVSGQDKKPKKMQMFRDTLDNNMDISDWLMNYHGVLPVPAIITEPAIGYGVGMALVYLEQPKKKSVSESRGVYSLPNAYFGFGMYTESKTYTLIAGLYRTINGDRIRVSALGGKASINTSIYQVNNTELSTPLDINLTNYIGMVKLETRIKESNFFVGTGYFYLNTDFSLNTNLEGPIYDEIENLLDKQIANGSTSLKAYYETRDNRFSPNKGLYLSAELEMHDNWTLSDYSYQILNTSAIYYTNTLKNPILGFRYEGNYSFGTYATFFKPFIMLRGVPFIKYQGRDVLVVENEERIDLNFRWSLVAFGGAGFTNNDPDKFDLKYKVWNLGTGFRYKMARALNLYAGIDIAMSGDQDWGWYITMGNAWMR